MALKYRLMVVAYGRSRSAGFPDFCDYEAAADCRRVQERDGRLYSIMRINVPTGTTPAQDELVRLVRGVRWHERQTPTRRRSSMLRREELERQLDGRIESINAALASRGNDYEPRDNGFYEFFRAVEEWTDCKRTIAQAKRLLSEARDRLVSDELLPVSPDTVAAIVQDRTECEEAIDAFIRRYDTAPLLDTQDGTPQDTRHAYTSKQQTQTDKQQKQ